MPIRGRLTSPTPACPISSTALRSGSPFPTACAWTAPVCMYRRWAGPASRADIGAARPSRCGCGRKARNGIPSGMPMCSTKCRPTACRHRQRRGPWAWIATWDRPRRRCPLPPLPEPSDGRRPRSRQRCWPTPPLQRLRGRSGAERFSRAPAAGSQSGSGPPKFAPRIQGDLGPTLHRLVTANGTCPAGFPIIVCCRSEGFALRPVHRLRATS